MNADSIVESKIESNHDRFSDRVGSKNFSINCSCVRLYTCLVFQMDKLKLMNFSVVENILPIQQLNWQSVSSPNSNLFLNEKIGMIVFCKYMLRLGSWPEKNELLHL